DTVRVRSNVVRTARSPRARQPRSRHGGANRPRGAPRRREARIGGSCFPPAPDDIAIPRIAVAPRIPSLPPNARWRDTPTVMMRPDQRVATRSWPGTRAKRESTMSRCLACLLVMSLVLIDLRAQEPEKQAPIAVPPPPTLSVARGAEGSIVLVRASDDHDADL